MSVCLCLFKSVCKQVCMYLCMCVCNVCMCVCVSVYVCVCIHVHNSCMHTRVYACFVHVFAECMLACIDHGSHQLQSARLFNKLQAAEHAAGIEGDSEGADNF